MALTTRPVHARGAVTIATHNRSAVSRQHNLRNERVVAHEGHIDLSRPHETWHDEAPRKAYERLFGEAVRDYNASQTRADRRIQDYYREICEDAKKHPVYEMIIGIYGRMEDGREICSEEEGKAIMQEFVRTWQQRNPNLELIGAYYHADEEGSPHVHIDYIPLGHGYTRGLSVQNGLVRALGEMGFEKAGRETAQIAWERRENHVLERLCIEHGFEVMHPGIEGAQHMSTALYKAQKELDTEKGVLNSLESVQRALRGDMELTQGRVDALRHEEKRLQERIDRKRASHKRGYTLIPTSELEELQRDHKSYVEALRVRREADLEKARVQERERAIEDERRALGIEKQKLAQEQDAITLRAQELDREVERMVSTRYRRLESLAREGLGDAVVDKALRVSRSIGYSL